jgi:hypothetical protein
MAGRRCAERPWIFFSIVTLSPVDRDLVAGLVSRMLPERINQVIASPESRVPKPES